jgi:hypothetical protein
VKGKPSAASVIFNITAICDGATQVFRLKAEGMKDEGLSKDELSL